MEELTQLANKALSYHQAAIDVIEEIEAKFKGRYKSKFQDEKDPHIVAQSEILDFCVELLGCPVKMLNRKLMSPSSIWNGDFTFYVDVGGSLWVNELYYTSDPDIEEIERPSKPNLIPANLEEIESLKAQMKIISNAHLESLRMESIGEENE